MKLAEHPVCLRKSDIPHWIEATQLRPHRLDIKRCEQIVVE